MSQIATAQLRPAGRHLRELIESEEFGAAGVIASEFERIKLIAIDPARHPLSVWERGSGRSYAGAGRALRATVFTNGPYMGRYTRVGVILRLVAGGLGGVGVAGVIDAVASARSSSPRTRPRVRLGARLAGGLPGLVAGWKMALTGWIPCGHVRGAGAGIADERDFADEGRTHAWIGRRGRSFGGYAVGIGNPPPEFPEAMGGLIPLVLGGRLCGANPAGPDSTADVDAARAAGKRVVVAWSLVPIPALGAGGGVLLVAASTRGQDSARLGAVLLALGARDAVGTDTSACAMLGRGSRFTIGPPPPHRQAIQRYGLCCRPSPMSAEPGGRP